MAAVLASRSYQLLWGAQFASLVAGFFNYVAVAWLALQLTGSSLAVGSVLAAASIPMAILMLVGGAASDRFSARATMLVSGLVRGGVVAVLAVLAVTGSLAFWHLLAAATVVGATTAFFVPAGQAMLPRVVPGDQLQAGNALLNLSRTAAMVLGSAAAGVVVAAVGGGAALAVDAAASVLAAALVLSLPGGGTSPENRRGGSTLDDIRDGLRYAWGDTSLRAMLIVVGVLNLGALGAIEVGLPLLAFQRFSEGATALGVTFAAWGIGSTVGSIVAGTRSTPARFGASVIAMVALIGAGVAAAGLAASLPVLVAVMVALGLVEGAGTTYLLSWLQRRTDPAMQGRVMAIAMLASVGLEPVALAVAGAVAAQDLGLLFWGSALVIEVTAIGAALSRAVRTM
jgi:MFS family permease